MAPLKDKITVGSKVIIAADADLRGEISIGSGSVIHPKATILAVQGPIAIGSNCIIEEMAVLVNRTKEIMRIGDDNLFEVGCRIEAPRIGSNNTFEIRCRVAHTIRVGSFCTVGTGCTLVPDPLWPDGARGAFSFFEEREGIQAEGAEGDEDGKVLGIEPAAVKKADEPESSEPDPTQTQIQTEPPPENQDAEQATSHSNPNPSPSVPAPKAQPLSLTQPQPQPQPREETIPDRTVIFGLEAQRRTWSGEGVRQAAALHAKHLAYLRETIPRFHKLKTI